MSKGTVKITTGKPALCPDTGDFKVAVTASCNDTYPLIVYQKLLDMNPDFVYRPELYNGKIHSPEAYKYEVVFYYMISSGEGKMDRDFEVFDRMIGYMVSGMMANDFSCHSIDAANLQ